jgi:hypothetical protein
MGHEEHVQENLKAAQAPLTEEAAWRQLFAQF